MRRVACLLLLVLLPGCSPSACDKAPAAIGDARKAMLDAKSALDRSTPGPAASAAATRLEKASDRYSAAVEQSRACSAPGPTPS